MLASQNEKELSFFCKSHSSFKTRLGILSLYQARFSNWFEILLLTFEYLQLISLTILIHPTVFQISSSQNKGHFFFEVIVYFFKLVNLSNLLSFSGSNSTTNAVLGIILGIMLLKSILAFYILYVSWFNRDSNNLLRSVWRWIFKLQGRVICCFLTSFWVNAIVMISNDSFRIQGISNRVLLSISIILIIMEYLVSFLLETQLCNFIMPTKNYLSSKNYDMQILTLFQKFSLQIIQLFISNDISTWIWVCIILNSMLSFFRTYRFFTTFPLYNYKSLLFQGDLSVLVLSLNLAHFFQQILISAKYSQEIEFRFLIILWIIIAMMSCKLSRTSVKHIHTQLLTNYHPKQNQNLLLHKIFATRHLIKNIRRPTEMTEKTDIKYFLNIIQTQNLLQVFNLNLQSKPISYDMIMNSKEEEMAIIDEYLENLTNQFPTNSLLKLNLAYHIYKSTKFHSKITSITSELNENILSPYQMSAALLLHDLEINEFNPHQENKKSLDLLNYMNNQILMQDIQKDILKQIILRKQICESIIGEKPDLEIIYQNSQMVHRSKSSIQNKINYFLKRAPEYYLNPLLIFAEYNLYLNYSIEDYHIYHENYSRKLLKFTKEFEVDNLSEENLYQNENAFLIISAENNSIVYSSKSFEDLCGFDKNNHSSHSFTKFLPQCLREYYNNIFKEIFEKGHSTFTNQSFHIYLYHQEGWLIEADIYLGLHPFLSQNLYLDLLIRPHSSVNNLILLDENGNIEGITQSMSQLFKSAKTSFHIKEISEELFQLNSAFNMINNTEGNLVKKSSNPLKSSAKFKNSFTFPELLLNYDKTLELYNLYTENAKLIELPFAETSRYFKCSISKELSLNLIRLDEVFHKPNENSIHNDFISHHNPINERKNVDNIISNHHWNLITRDFYIHNRYLSSQTRNDSLNTYDDEIEEIQLTSRPFLSSSLPSVTSTLNTPRYTEKLPHKIPLASTNISIGTSKISQISGIFIAFQRAIKNRSHQKSFNFLCLIFYGVILGTLICQIVLKSVLDNTMNHLIIKTDLLNFAQRRTLQACAIHNIARGCSLVIDGLLGASDMNLADRPLRNYLEGMILPEQVLTRSNKGIISNLASEDDTIQHMLFEKDIQIKGSVAEPYDSKTELVTNFQHSDILRSTIRVLNSLPLLAADPGARAFDFLTFNSANDFLVKNDQIIQTFQNSVDNQKENFQLMINLIVIILPILLTGIICLLTVIIWKQYSQEERLLLAFLKLNPTSIQHILENLTLFENRLIQQEKLQDKLVPKLIYRLEHDPQVTSYHKGHDSQVVIYGRMQKRYFLYTFQVLFYIALLIAIVILNYVFLTKSIDGIYIQQKQIQFANTIGSTCAVTYIAFSESFVTNNTNYIMGQPPFDVFTSGIKNVSRIQATLYTEFQLKNGEYDPDVRSILFDEMNCNRFAVSAYENCVSLKSLNLPTNMASTITLYKNMLDTKLAQFLAVNRSSPAAMISAALAQLSYILGPYRVTSAEAELISDIMSEKLTHSVQDIYRLGTTILIIFSFTLVAVSVLIWFQILTKVKKVNDNFKKVLAVLPPNIVLSSFLLKTFLNKTSNIPQKL